MFNLSHFFASLFAATAQQAAEEEQCESEERVDRILEGYDREQEEERQFFQRLDEEHEREKEQASRKWYNHEREQLEWEMRNAELYGYNKEDIKSRMDWLDEQEEKEDW